MPEHAALQHGSRGAQAEEQHLVFYVSGRPLGVALRYVSEILPYEHVTTVPGLPPAVRGVVHVRGRMMPVMDAALRLGLVPEPATKRSCILMLDVLDAKGRRQSYGITSDRVSTLLDVESHLIQPVPDFGLDVDVRFLSGLIQMDGAALPLVSPVHLFHARELEQMRELVSSGQEALP